MQINKQTQFIIAIGFQLLVIFLMIIFNVAIISGGKEVLLKIEPVDPRDPLRGDYLTFRYAISNPFRDLGYYPTDLRDYGYTVYVILQQSGKYWTVKRVEKSKPFGTEEVFIKGKFVNNTQVAYGIEQYFIPEGKGTRLPFGPNNEAYAKVAIDTEGNAVLKQVFINDKPVF